ncbi:DUF3817 domain-containing protein [Paeniglutamicibacter cryotolerans]|uniref:Integral membrane protein n=1 Tax=Paeniglutamicibacter cryotolerans TaxID=670079 RepID=A0A839QLR7_9MICC|nr:DUF3817 domain-containing protein [Paeniglutamicibacter cryotolerans]MBB2994956.1 integral membrane protein [Paeniglutamicibacter cryotolerans]
MPTINDEATRDLPALGTLPPKRLYGALAAAEMVTWALLITGMVFKYTGVTDALVRVFGLIHGIVFISYCIVTCFVWVNQRWSFGRGVAGLFSAIIPFATLPFERSAAKHGLLEGGWRLAPGGEAPVSFIEKVQALCLRRPLLAGVVGLVAVAAITTVLLIIGPPGS